VTKKKKEQRTDAETWDAIQAEMELDRIKSLTPEEVNAEIRAAGGDPEAIGQRGAELAKKLLAERGMDWKARAAARRAETEKRAGAMPSFAAMPRTELLARIAAARSDKRFSAPVVAAFRKRREEEASDDELRALLEEIELLRRMHGDEDE
jgi:hypothetical protein